MGESVYNYLDNKGMAGSYYTGAGFGYGGNQGTKPAKFQSPYASGYAAGRGGSSYGEKSGGGGFQQPANLSGAIRAYEDIAKMSSPKSGPASISVGASPDPNANNWTLRDQNKTPSYGGRGGGGGGSVQQNKQYTQRKAIAAPDMPDYAAPEYKPPEEDPTVYKKARQMAIAPGLREARQRTREAIMSSYALDNPNQRSEFIRNAIKGYGEGLEGISSQAGKEARQEAGRKRSEQLQLYNAQYAAKSKESMINYQNEINKLMEDFNQQKMIADDAYQYGRENPQEEVVGASRGYITGIGGRQIAV